MTTRSESFELTCDESVVGLVFSDPKAKPEDGDASGQLAALSDVKRLGSVLRLASAALHVPAACIAIWQGEEPSVRVMRGMSVRVAEAVEPWCQWVRESDGPLLIPDTRVDARTEHHKLVTSRSGVRMFSGWTLPVAKGHTPGVLCVMDQNARTLGSREVETLEDLARWAANELSLTSLDRAHRKVSGELESARQAAMHDPVLKVWNRATIQQRLESELVKSRRTGEPVGVAMIDLDHFKKINDTMGHAAGDEALHGFVDRLNKSLRPTDTIGRYGGDEFVAVLGQADRTTVTRVAERMRSLVSNEPLRTSAGPLPLTLSAGVATTDGRAEFNSQELLRDADRALYVAKQKGRNQVCMI